VLEKRGGEEKRLALIKSLIMRDIKRRARAAVAKIELKMSADKSTLF